MQIHKISNINFGKIILDCKDPVPAGLLFNAKEALDKNRPNNDFDPFIFLCGELLPKVIESDYNTPALKKRYDELVKSQEKNPHNIHLDLFLYDEGEMPLYPEGWFQKATVGNKVFLQRQFDFEGTAISFLEKACQYANELNRKGRPVVDIPACEVPVTFSRWQNLRTVVKAFLANPPHLP